MTCTRELASFTANMTYDRLTPHSREMAKRCMLDWLGIAIRGSRETPPQILRRVLGPSGRAEATVFADGLAKDSVYQAALWNGAASHSLDFDDLHNPSIIHPACVVIPGVFAIGEKEHASGRDMIAAVCAGYEASGRVGESVIPESYYFWHTTGTAGTFGAAAAAANLLHLDTDRTVQCYGSAGTQAAGLCEFLKDGAMSKSLHAGKSAFAGVLSAYFVRIGLSAAWQILEGEKGFCRARVAKPHLEKLSDRLSYDHLKIDNNSFMPYACCKHSHAALYALQTLRAEKGLTPDQIDRVEVRVNEITNYLINNENPKTPYGCKFSLQYCCAAMLVKGVVGIEEFTAQAIADPVVNDLMRRVSVVLDKREEAIHQADPSKLASTVRITLTDGTVLTRHVDYPKGDPDNPLSWEEAKDKFMHLAVPVLGQATSDNLYQLILHLEEADDFATALAEALRPSLLQRPQPYRKSIPA